MSDSEQLPSALLRKLQLPAATFAPTAATPAPSASTADRSATSNSLTDAVDTLYDEGYETAYGDLCEKLFASMGLAVQTVKVSYDYEMTLSTLQPVPPGYTPLSYWTPALEWGTLWTVAQELGLHGCEVKDNEALQLAIRPSVIVSLSSLRTDRTVGTSLSCLLNWYTSCIGINGGGSLSSCLFVPRLPFCLSLYQQKELPVSTSAAAPVNAIPWSDPCRPTLSETILPWLPFNSFC